MEIAPGALWFRGALSRAAQEALAADIRAVVAEAPLFAPAMPRTGKPFSVRMTNCGPLGWVSDASGYRYQSFHPDTRRPWPVLPHALLDLWRAYAGYDALPEACLVNFYDGTARMGLHQDRDEADLVAPVLSVSLGDTCLFRIGGPERKDPTRPVRLQSGDVLRLGGQSRLAFHGVDRVMAGSSTLLDGGGRLNLTLRRVNVS